MITEMTGSGRAGRVDALFTVEAARRRRMGHHAADRRAPAGDPLFLAFYWK